MRLERKVGEGSIILNEMFSGLSLRCAHFSSMLLASLAFLLHLKLQSSLPLRLISKKAAAE